MTDRLSTILWTADSGLWSSLYIYLSNENEDPVEVFFDDFKVEHIKSLVVQMEEYYPFGLRFNSFQRESSVDQRWKFQGQEHIDDLGLNWDSFKWRNHQPDIGRFFNVDPLADKYVYNSPYAFSENKVTSHVELEGLEAMKMPDAVGMVKGEWKKIEGAVMPVIGEALHAIGIDLPGLNLPRESTDKQQKGDGIHIYSDSNGPDSQYAPAADPNATTRDVEKSVIDGVLQTTKATSVPSASDIGEAAKNIASGIDKAAKAGKILENVMTDKGGEISLEVKDIKNRADSKNFGWVTITTTTGKDSAVQVSNNRQENDDEE